MQEDIFMSKIKDRIIDNIYYQSNCINLSISKPEEIKDIEQFLLNYYSELGTNLFIKWLYKYTEFDNRLKCLTEGYSLDEILSLAQVLIPKLVDSKLYTFVNYFTEDGYYFNDDTYDLSIRREYVYYILRCYYTKLESNKILDKISDEDLLDLSKLETNYKIKFIL